MHKIIAACAFPLCSERWNNGSSHQKTKTKKNFIIHCSKSGCGASFTKILSFKRHHYRKHASESEEDEDEINDHADLPLNEIEQSVISKTQQAEAQFLLKLKSEQNLSKKQ